MDEYKYYKEKTVNENGFYVQIGVYKTESLFRANFLKHHQLAEEISKEEFDRLSEALKNIS